ncbi:hypothetical protein GOV03_03620 [Candidatus Woesearchaeota archaeon]|nr:hypothetical protein [Candidatus Woesearchaeota archaeon]
MVDEDGCSSDQVSDDDRDKDTDNDGLPDYWELMYDAVGCELDFTNDDSNMDGVFDASEDYDGDDYDNYDEYMAGFDPCVMDEPPQVDIGDMGGTVPQAESSAVAWTLFILGLVMVLGGSGYLIYLYKFTSRVKVSARPAVQRVARPVAAKPGFSFRDRLSILRRRRSRKEKARKREAVFGAFSKKSSTIPNVEQAIRKKGPHLSKLGDLVKKHAKIKEKIKPGLRPGEKGVFAKLESIAKKSKGKKIDKVVSKKEAKTIFDKLKEISKQRKNGK